MLDNLAKELHQTAVDKGFWNHEVDDMFFGKQCMMIVSEVTEVMEAVRKDRGSEEVVKEFADIIIRTLDLWAGLTEHGFIEHSLDEMLEEKRQYNKTRPERHGVRF